MKKIIAVIVVLIIAAGAAYFLLKNNSNEPKFKTEIVTRGDITEAVTATGSLNAVTTILVGTQASGTIKRIFVDFNSPVKKNQLIAQIDPATFEAQLEQARANFNLARANSEKSKASLVDAERTLDRTKQLYSKNLVAKSELDTALTNFDISRALLGASEAQVSQAEAALKLTDINLKYTSILSPVDGVVISRNVDVGQTVAASFQTPTLFTIAEDLTKMQIDTNVNEADIGRVSTGQDVAFTVDAYPDALFHGKVLQIRNAPIIIQNVVTYDVVIKVDNPRLKLKPGMTANAQIISAEKKGVLKAPNAAMRFRLNNDKSAKAKNTDAGPSVWVLEAGTPRRVKITVGISDGSFTEISSGDVKEGQELIIESLSKLKKPAIAGPRMF
ncbi:efflux RND transporter periplasmic adaptor subunit [bacterium]|nr:MAG: efflux RND transporter periplasmic adaptor subunit [bacterium]